MSSDESNQNGGGRSEELCVAALLRCAADGELTSEQEARLCAHLDESPGCTQRIEFETKLREACRETLGASGGCTEQLRGRIEAMVSEARGSSSDAQGFRAGVSGAATAGEASLTRQPSFWSGAGVRGLAAAAVLVLSVAGAFQLGRGSVGGTTAAGSGVVLAARTMEHVSAEHSRCTTQGLEGGDSKFTTSTLEELPRAFGPIFGEDVTLRNVLDKADSVRFVDAGYCGLPGEGRSMHIRLSSASAEGEERHASLFVQRVGGATSFEEGRTYHLAAGQHDDRPCVFAWRSGGLMYWLVCDRTDASSMREAVGAPAIAGAA